jgi:uncharacterized protein (TIGR01244 family)
VRLAELGLAGARFPAEGVLTGGQPSAAQLHRAGEIGVKAVIDLRAPAEAEQHAFERATAAEAGMAYFQIPIDAATGAGLDQASARRLEAILAEAGRPVIVHCASGQRVGALFALKAFHVDGKSPAEALQIGREAGLSRPDLEELVTAQMEASAVPGGSPPR